MSERLCGGRVVSVMERQCAAAHADTALRREATQPAATGEAPAAQPGGITAGVSGKELEKDIETPRSDDSAQGTEKVDDVSYQAEGDSDHVLLVNPTENGHGTSGDAAGQSSRVIKEGSRAERDGSFKVERNCPRKDHGRDHLNEEGKSSELSCLKGHIRGLRRRI